MRAHPYSTTQGALEADRREEERAASATFHDRFQPPGARPTEPERNMGAVDALNMLEWLVVSYGRPRWPAFEATGRDGGEFEAALEAYQLAVRLLREHGRNV